MKIPFDSESRKKFYENLEQVFASGVWSDGEKNAEFERRYGEEAGLLAASFVNGGAALRALAEFVNVRGKDVLSPVNTFWATHLAIREAGGNPVFVDCNREDLCLSLSDLKRRITPKTAAVMLTHVGGHIAFEIEGIVDFCRSRGLALIEDCAHAHGAEWNGKKAGAWGVGGAYSFYATKTMPLGEGGMLVSANRELIDWAKKYRNYGKEIVGGEVTYPVKDGFNYRMSEFTAALGLVQLDRLPEILREKRSLAAKYDEIFASRLRVPSGMTSGFYKYVVFGEKLKRQTGKVFRLADSGPAILGEKLDHPNFEWAAENHACAPIYSGFEGANCSPAELRRMLL